ncbi:hypothetical protein VP01_2719g5 [Puccinia sorghi]|uniref:Uncharacterized protein n=1 Tax=Puccinia sorghi TaxID=27349 RepID=A0A0L6V437_9BASI|nr:hypothetical protein VP01_2719g5 [Puccinia sorghi]
MEIGKKQQTKPTAHKFAQRHSLDSGQKKAPVLWEKDGQGGLSSICVVLDWLAVYENYQCWQGDTRIGSPKAAPANKILSIMAELVLLDDNIANGTSALPGRGPPIYTQKNILIATLIKILKFWDELDPIMGARKVSNPPVTTDSTQLREFNL